MTTVCILCFIALGIISMLFIGNLPNYDFASDHITKGLYPKCKHFDKYSERCFAPEKSKYSKRLGYIVYTQHEPIDGNSGCIDYIED